MRLAYLNTNYKNQHTGGGPVHMGQFIENALQQGHEVWGYANTRHPGVRRIPEERWQHIRTMRQMDVLYVRIEGGLPSEGRWALPPRRLLYGFPVVAWEFNTSPEYGYQRGQSQAVVSRVLSAFQRYGKGCDLAVCVTHKLADYVHNTLGISNTLVVPNGSDPELFRPDAPIAQRMLPFQGQFNVVWIGSGKERWHDFEMLRDAARILSRDNADKKINFHVIGPDITGVMADMPGNVYYWGAEYYPQLPQWLSAMDVGLSLYQPGPAEFNSPLKVFDYLSSGLAVISTPSPFIHGLFEELAQPDMVVPHGDSSRLAALLVALASDRQYVRAQGMKGRQRVMDYYNWKRAVHDTMDAIEALLAAKKKRG